MRRLFFILLLFFIALPAFALPVRALEPDELKSDYACLMDLETGQVLFDKSMSEQAYPASTTKIMTAVLALEHAYPGEMLTVSDKAVRLPYDSSHIALSPEEKISLDSALYALMLPSANDAANAIAEYIGGSQEAFASMMTAKAHALGAVHTNFLNAHGLHDDAHVTTAFDLALITRYAAGNKDFMRYFGSPHYTMPPTNLQPLERPFTNYQYMTVPTSRFYDPEVLGGKVGYTTPARHTMSTVAKRGGRTLICIVLSSPNRNDKFSDTKKLLEYGFTAFERAVVKKDMIPADVPLLSEEGPAGAVHFQQGGGFSVLLPKGVDPAAVRAEYQLPGGFRTGDRLTGKIVYYLDGTSGSFPALLGTQEITGTPEFSPLELSPPEAAMVSVSAAVSDQAEAERNFTATGGWIAGILGFLALALLTVLSVRHVRLKRRRARRMRRMQDAAARTSYSVRQYSYSGTAARPARSGAYRSAIRQK